ncbi:hypothetical protein H9L39_19420 [Fusarium oxysporum f. sp. albedinis]|nr:hypothetical protein H9L39_19420 [Fusarium oxysporum f. sp. albedinis]
MEAADHGKRRACESCRRKKCRCTGERPICSYCQRRNIACVYLPRAYPTDATSNTVTKWPSLQDNRFQRLESQVAQIYSMLNSIPSHHCPDSSAMPSVEHHESSIYFGTQASASNTSHGSTPNDIPHFGMAPDILDHLIDVYRVKLHIQPLPLFNIGTLREVLANAQPYLVWSFLALVLPLSSPEFPGHPDPETVALDTQSAKSTVMRMAADGIPRLDVVQSLCLLALKDVMENMLNRAWMTIGTASRLEALRQAGRRHAGCRIPDQDASSRCYWSVFILERIFGVSERLNLVDLEAAPEYLSSYPTPPSNFHNGHDLGQEDSRAPSKYLNVEILDFDTELYPAHRLKNRGLSGRLHTELSKEQEYWYPWLMVQIASHASLALINHPFLHLGVMPTKDGRLQSGTFVQQTVDQSLFHSGWVLRILSFFETLPFQLNDPSVGHLVAAVATILWIFQFARDPRVSMRAREEVRKIVALLEQISSSWPHLSHKLEILQSLQATAGCQLWGIEPKNTTITFHSSKLWQLLDSNLADELYASTCEGGDVMVDNRDPDIMLHVVTRYLDPLEDRDMQQALDITSSTLPTAGALDNLPEKDCLSPFLPEDFEWLQAF